VGPTAADRPPYFFLSYAHDAGEDDESVRRFYQELTHDVRLFAGDRTGAAAGFCDVSFRLGDQWSPALIENLSTAQVFVPILSPVYFASEACGKEWTVFTKRMTASGPPRAGESPLVPLLWVPMNPPAVAQSFQYREPAFGKLYNEIGLRRLLREKKYEDDCSAFVQTLARRIVELNKLSRVREATDRPGFDDVRAAFPVSAAAGRTVKPRTEPDLKGDNAGQPPAGRPHRSMPRLNTAHFTPKDDLR
jgi:TIR domain-containing protein